MKIFNPVKTREPLSKIVAQQIEEAIQLKKIRSGEKLPTELELCDQFSVSRTAIREALRTLSTKGLITIEKGRGIFVRESSSDVVADQFHFYLQMNNQKDYALDIVQVRQIIEPPMAALAALHHSDGDIEILRADLEEYTHCDGDFAELAKLDVKFHLDIAKASHNSIMPLILGPIHQLIPQIGPTVYATNIDARESASKWHRQIFERILQRDAEGSRNAMIQHLKIAEEHAHKMLKAKKMVSSTDN